MYEDRYSEEMVKCLSSLKKRDSKQYELLIKAIDKIRANPEHNYKFLHYSMKGIQRVHIGHFVLVFIINHENKIVSFEDYKHHDKIYF
jgi:mRNA-degrading endonuclease RelE of RelBE toxin-antitoxin system